MLANLVERGHFVTLYPLMFPTEPWEEVYRDIPREVEVMVGWDASRLAGFLQERGGYYDTILVCRPHNMSAFLSAKGSVPGSVSGSRVVYDAEAVFALREFDRMDLQGKTLSPKTKEKKISEEMALAQRADVVLTVCERERKVFNANGIESAFILSHSLDVQPTQTEFSDRKDLLFVGAIPDEQSPNGESLIWFVNEVLPKIREQLDPQIRLRVAGVTESERIRSLDSSSVIILGYVDDLEELYTACRIFVAPMRFGAGIPIKVCESAAYGLPVVASSLIASHLGWRDGVDLLEADGTDAKAYADACARLYSDEVLWRKLRQNALARTKEECSPERFRKTILEVFG
jgi:glycosyltransferase involved in cell wall biosynthesis